MNHKIFFLATFVLVMLMCHISFASDFENHWASQEIQRAVHDNMITISHDQFFPDQAATASEIEKIFESFMKKNGFLSSEDSLSVEKQNSYFLENNPNACITREELAIIVSKVLNFDIEIDLEAQTTFNDNEEILHWARGYVAKLQEINILKGYPDLSFKPGKYITKAELVTVMNRCQDYLGQEVTITKDRDVSMVEIGILKYESGKAIVSPIHEEIKLSVNESVHLAVMIQNDSFEDDLSFVIENEDVAMLDEETYTIEARKVGMTSIAVYLQKEMISKFNIIVE